MKLGKLLAAGKSIMNGRTDISYRSSKQIYLPKFGSPKNPFKPESAEQPAERVPCSAATEPRASASGSESIAVAVAVSVGAKETPRPVSREVCETAIGRDAIRSNSLAASKQSEGWSKLLPRQSEAKVGQRGNAAKSSVGNSPAGNSQSAAAVAHTAQSPKLSKFNPFLILRDALPGGKAKASANTVKGQKGTPTQAELSLDSVRVVHNDLSDVDVEVVPIKSRSTVPDLPAPKKSWEFVGERLFGVEAT